MSSNRTLGKWPQHWCSASSIVIVLLTMQCLEQVQENSIDLQDIAVRDNSDMSITTNGNQTQSHVFSLGTNGTLQQLHQSRSDTGLASVRTVSVLFNTESRFASVWPNNGDSGPLLVYGDVQGGLRVVLLDTDANILANSSIYI